MKFGHRKEDASLEIGIPEDDSLSSSPDTLIKKHTISRRSSIISLLIAAFIGFEVLFFFYIGRNVKEDLTPSHVRKPLAQVLFNKNGSILTRFPGPDLDLFADKPSVYENETILVRDACFESIKSFDMDIGPRTDKMLVGISVGPAEFERRQLIRTHQIRRYSDSYNITFKFVMGYDPSSLYNEMLKHENETFGDLIILESLKDSRKAARLRKPFEFFRFVEANLPIYKFVAKMDSDTFISMPDFTRDYFNLTIQESDDFVVISHFIKAAGKFDWPQGGFEAVSWKVMLLLNRMYNLVPLSSICEDMQIEWYLYDAQVNYTKIDLGDNRSHDFRKGSHPPFTKTDIFSDTVMAHELKTNNDYINVARCFDSNGVNMTQVGIMRNRTWN